MTHQTAANMPTTSPAAPNTGGDRLLFIDHLRNAIVISLILFHTARLFDIDPWHIKNAETYRAADILIALLNVFSMPLLFLLAGASACLSLRKRSISRFARERMTRLFLPLLVGMILIVPPQVYVERVSGAPLRISPIDFSGSFLEFYPTYFRCCYPVANFSYHHLWFVWYLFAYSLLLAPIFALLRRPNIAETIGRLGGWLATGWRFLLLALPLIAIELALRRTFPSNFIFVGDWTNHAHYLALMLIGWLIAASPPLVTAMARRWRILLAAAIALTTFWIATRFLGPRLPFEARLTMRTIAEWLWMGALIGLTAARLNRPVPVLTAFSPLSFAFYIFHQTVIVLLGFWFYAWVDQPLAKYATIAALSFAISYALARLSLMSAPTRLAFGAR